MQYLLAAIYGLVFGIANIIPGVSGGTMLVVFGCYDKVCGALSLNLKEIKKNIVFLIFFGIGAVVGLLGFAVVIRWLFGSFPTETYMFFMGLIAGSIPLILRNATVSQKFTPVCAIPFVLALALVVGLTMLEQSGIVAAPSDLQGIGAIALFLLAGFVAAVAMIIPGVSGSFIMVLFGTYEIVISSIHIHSLNFGVIIPTAIGVVAGLVLGARMITFLLKKFRLIVFSAILGLVVGSLYAIFPAGFGFNPDTFIGVLTLAVGFAIAFIVGKKTKVEEEQ
jgi:putative membrane protein